MESPCHSVLADLNTGCNRKHRNTKCPTTHLVMLVPTSVPLSPGQVRDYFQFKIFL